MTSTTHCLPAARGTSSLERLQPVGASHDDVRRYSRARRNVLPRADHVTAVSGGWAHEVVLRSARRSRSCCGVPARPPYPDLEADRRRGLGPRPPGPSGSPSAPWHGSSRTRRRRLCSPSSGSRGRSPGGC